MSRLHPVRPGEVIPRPEGPGFRRVRQRGSHKFFRHPDGRTATVPDHKGEDLGRGILAKILRDAGAKPAEFLGWLT